ncbi:hypothetical protein ACU686_40010 [Yinghuangia aomiensis]
MMWRPRTWSACASLLPVARHNHAMALTDGGDYAAAIAQFRAALDAGGSETTRNMMAQCYAIWGRRPHQRPGLPGGPDADRPSRATQAA